MLAHTRQTVEYARDIDNTRWQAVEGNHATTVVVAIYIHDFH